MNDQTLIGIYTLTLMGVMLLFLFCLVVLSGRNYDDSVVMAFVYRSIFMFIMGYTVSLLV